MTDEEVEGLLSGCQQIHEAEVLVAGRRRQQ